jgi:hypothetical protein
MIEGENFGKSYVYFNYLDECIGKPGTLCEGRQPYQYL